MTRPTITTEQLRWFRMSNSGLITPFSSTEEAARSLFGIQAQILPAAALSLWNRTNELSHKTFEKKLFEDRSMVKLWGQRGTLHLYEITDWPLLIAARGEKPTWFDRQATTARAKKKYQDAIQTAKTLLEAKGTITRDALREAGVSDEFLSSWGGLFATLVARGLACHGPQEAGEGTLYSRTHWSPNLSWETPTTEEANISIARRAIKAYGPFSVKDFGYWRGAPMADAKRWIDALRPELSEVSVNDEIQLVLKDDLERLTQKPKEKEEWPLKALYRFDPLLLAHKDKSWVVPQRHYNKVWRPAGHIEGIILEQGQGVATWRYERTAKALSIEVSPFSKLSKETKDAFWQKAKEVATFFDLELSK
jgi:hypothetical protein